MADLDRLEQDLGFLRRAVDGAAPRSPASIYFLWAVLVLAGFALVDLNENRVGLYWMIAGPAGGLISAYSAGAISATSARWTSRSACATCSIGAP